MLTPEIEKKIMEQVMIPTVEGMAKEGCPFKGVLFAGVMIKDGEIKTLEHNVRFGDPECQVVMMRLRSDLLKVNLSRNTRFMVSCAEGFTPAHLLMIKQSACAPLLYLAEGACCCKTISTRTASLSR